MLSGWLREFKNYKNHFQFLPKKVKIFTKILTLIIDSVSISIILGKNWVITKFYIYFGGKIDEQY